MRLPIFSSNCVTDAANGAESMMYLFSVRMARTAKRPPKTHNIAVISILLISISLATRYENIEDPK